MNEINYNELKNNLVQWMQDWFSVNGNGCNAIIGVSGGKDSTVALGLCVEAIGKDRVIGVAIPDNNQGLNGAKEICDFFGVKCLTVNIGNVTDALKESLGKEIPILSNQTTQNIPPRVRMTVLYAVAQSMNGRVIGTSNYSENFISYFTRWGDGASDVEPFGLLTVHDVKELGYVLGIPKEWVDKTPDDGLPHSCPDEEKFGFTYETLDTYLRTGKCDDFDTQEKIKEMHKKGEFKLKPIPVFPFYPYDNKKEN